jgi:hypothetical protein
VVTLVSGEICTFGKGEYGRLGHGESEHVDADGRGEVNVLLPRVLAELRV